jgi:hypothetical protein
LTQLAQTWSHSAYTPATVSSTEHARGTQPIGHAAERR